jgi:hypothetical protein
VGGFKVGERVGQDVDLWLRLAFRYPIAWSGERLAVYYRNAVNRTVGKRFWTQEPAVSCSARQAIAAGLVPPEQIKSFKEYVAHFQIIAIRELLIQGKKDEALKLLDYSRGTRRFARQWWKWRIIAALPYDSAGLWKLKQSAKRWLRVSERGR